MGSLLVSSSVKPEHRRLEADRLHIRPNSLATTGDTCQQNKINKLTKDNPYLIEVEVPTEMVPAPGVPVLVDECPPDYSVNDPLNAENELSSAQPQARNQHEEKADVRGNAGDNGQPEGKKSNALGILLITLKIICVHGFLYIFIISLNLLSQAFRLLGGKTAGGFMSNHVLLQNPLTGLMIGILATVLMQSSSTSTSIVVTMVASNMIDVEPAISIIMGANIGTSVTNTIVSLAQYGNRDEFRRAFSAATVHDMFNWLSVCLLLTVEVCTGYLYKLSGLMVSNLSLPKYKTRKFDMLKVITKPVTNLIVQLDKEVIEGIATGQYWGGRRLLKVWCKYNKTYILQNVTREVNVSSGEGPNLIFKLQNETQLEEAYITSPTEKCYCLMSYINWNDSVSGVVLLVISLLSLVFCLMGMVRLLHSMLRGPVASALKKTINSDIPKPCSFLTGYVAIIIGAILTIILQSSSIFTSTLTPLVGMGVIHIERMYPLTLGSNIGTTATGLLAAMATSGDKLKAALQIGLCHLLFNLTGILIFYPVPVMRKLPINLAKMLGNTTAKYRWFAFLYLLTAFFLLPAFVFALSLAGKYALITACAIIIPLLAFIIIVNILQRKMENVLPKVLRNWDWLPLCLHSLEPMDKFLSKFTGFCKMCQKKLDQPRANEGSSLSTINNSCGVSPGADSPSSFHSTARLIQDTTKC
ncbi:sodium-dependent phosphate transport protein 2A [Octopus sinensis]|uniref:Sodium-dependent phosphate transport protein 2A n=1 Tax=Octopus sinensis TaxID=2607531 RepID=A0A6P7S950_9MOLL|nr:sodium-dependent phosphate transport protein 2A [Octopus sinensis]